MTYVAPTTHVAGETLPAADWNIVVNDIIAHQSAIKVIQVLSASTTTQVSSVTSTPVDTGLTISITPGFTSSKVLVLVALHIYSNTTNCGATLSLLRGATTLATNLDTCYTPSGSNSQTWSAFILDTPATTSATTYKVQMHRATGIGTVYAQSNSNPSTIVAMEIAVP